MLSFMLSPQGSLGGNRVAEAAAGGKRNDVLGVVEAWGGEHDHKFIDVGLGRLRQMGIGKFEGKCATFLVRNQSMQSIAGGDVIMPKRGKRFGLMPTSRIVGITSVGDLFLAWLIAGIAWLGHARRPTGRSHPALYSLGNLRRSRTVQLSSLHPAAATAHAEWHATRSRVPGNYKALQHHGATQLRHVRLKESTGQITH